jgi:hypothetical protein
MINKTEKYLWSVLSCIYENKEVNNLINGLLSTKDCRIYLNYKDLTDYKFYIQVRNKSKKLKSCNIILKTAYYYDNKQFVDLINGEYYTVFILNIPNKTTTLPNLLNSKYSRMYYNENSENLYPLLFNREVISKFKLPKVDIYNDSIIMNKLWYVLVHSEDYFNAVIRPLFDGFTEEEINKAKQNEYDSKFEPEMEFLK